MSRLKRKISDLLISEDDTNFGDFSSRSEDVYIQDNVNITESESSLNPNSSSLSSRTQVQNNSHKSKFNTYFNIESNSKGTNRDKIARCTICVNSKEIKA